MLPTILPVATEATLPLVAHPDSKEALASMFVAELGTLWDFLATYEDDRPVLTLTFDDGRVGAVSDFPDIGRDLTRCISAYFDIPHTGTLHATAEILRSDHGSWNLELYFEGLGGPVVILFEDGSRGIAADVTEPEQPLGRWQAGVSSGLVQQQLEAVVTLARQVDLLDHFDVDDVKAADAILALLSALATTKNPSKDVAGGPLRWLGRKVDSFIDAAVKVAGGTAGVAAMGATGYVLKDHFSELAAHISDLIDAAR